MPRCAEQEGGGAPLTPTNVYRCGVPLRQNAQIIGILVPDRKVVILAKNKKTQKSRRSLRKSSSENFRVNRVNKAPLYYLYIYINE